MVERNIPVRKKMSNCQMYTITCTTSDYSFSRNYHILENAITYAEEWSGTQNLVFRDDPSEFLETSMVCEPESDSGQWLLIEIYSLVFKDGPVGD